MPDIRLGKEAESDTSLLLLLKPELTLEEKSGSNRGRIVEKRKTEKDKKWAAVLFLTLKGCLSQNTRGLSVR